MSFYFKLIINVIIGSEKLGIIANSLFTTDGTQIDEDEVLEELSSNCPIILSTGSTYTYGTQSNHNIILISMKDNFHYSYTYNVCLIGGICIISLFNISV